MTQCPVFKEFHKLFMTQLTSEYHLNQWLKIMEEFAEEHKNTLDGELIIQMRAFWHIITGEFDEALAILNRLEESEYNWSKLFAYSFLRRYYEGWNNPSIDLKKGEEYHKKYMDLYPNVVVTDEWDKAIIETNKIFEEFSFEPSYEKRCSVLIPKLRNAYNKIQEYGQSARSFVEITFVYIFFYLGKFDKAIESIQATIKFYNNKDTSYLGYGHLIEIAIIQGKLGEAEEFLNQIWDSVEEGGNYWLKTLMYSDKARLSEIKSDFEETEKILTNIVSLNESEGKELHVFRAFKDLFEYYYRTYRITNNKDYREKAIEVQSKLEEIAHSNPNNTTITKLTKLAKAQLLKFGGIKDRTKAIFFFEDLLKFYPTSLEIRIHLVELYFEDLARDPTGEAKTIIDSYLEDIQKSPLMKNPSTITEYSSYQILVAKYIYYLKGDINKALNILYEVKDLSEKFGLKLVEDTIGKEIMNLENEVQKWSNISLSIKDRIEQSNMHSYFKSAQKIIQLN